MTRRSGSTPTVGSRRAGGTKPSPRSRTWSPLREKCGMDAAELRITAEPIDTQRCKFVVSVPAVAGSPKPPGAVNDDALYEQVAKVFDEQVNPMVARHGGRVELIDVQDAVVMLRMGGGCQGCGMADVTLRQGIEGMLAQFVPAVRGIVDITDHTSGANPYFQAAKK